MSNNITAIAGSMMAAVDAHAKSSVAEVKRAVPADQQTDAPFRQEFAKKELTVSDRQQVEEAVVELSERVQSLRTSVQFSIDNENDRMIIKVVDVERDEVILQLPPEEVLALAKFFAGDKFDDGGLTSEHSHSEGLLIREQA